MVYLDETKKAGWDDLYKECFEGINEIVKDNLESKHNEELIEEIFPKMLDSLDRAVLKMKELDGEKTEKEGWFSKCKGIKEFAEKADTLNKKVVVITIIDQFLRSTY